MARTRSQCALKKPSQPGGGGSISKTQRRCARTREVAMAAGAQGLQGQKKKMKKQHRRPLLFRIGAGNRMVIPFGPFAYLVREIHKFHSRKVTCWTPEALLLLQSVAEFYLEVMFENQLTFTTHVELGLAVISNMDNYFTNLLGNNTDVCDLTWGENQFESPPEQILEEQSLAETMLPEQSPANTNPTGRKRRTRNFSIDEDILLCKTWLAISQDAIHGNEQKRGTYWSRIHDHYHAHKEAMPSDRNQSALSHRWGIIQDCVSKFTGAHTQIQNRNQSGVSEHDKVQHSCALYTENDPLHRSFTLLHCWNILQHAPKWCDFIASQNKKQKTSSNASPSMCPPGSGESHHGDEDDGLTHTSPRKPRPMGRKKAKQLQGKNSASCGESLYEDALINLRKAREQADELKEIKKKERNDARLEIEKARLEQKRESDNRRHEIMEKELEHKQRMDDERVINMDLSAMREPQLSFYKQWQEEILARRAKERQVEK